MDTTGRSTVCKPRKGAKWGAQFTLVALSDLLLMQ